MNAWLRSASRGHCGATTVDPRNDCSHGASSAFQLKVPRAASAEVFQAACLAACSRCSRCEFLSMSHKHRDCSWYLTCDLTALRGGGMGFVSGRRPKLASPPPAPPPPPMPSPLPPLPSGSASLSAAFGGPPKLSPAQLERGLVSVGDAVRLRRKLRLGLPVLLSALGSSNTVRGGCEAWQGGKCSGSKYAGGWLLQALRALNASYPHAGHRLVNRAMMATGPAAFVRCLNAYVPRTPACRLEPQTDRAAPKSAAHAFRPRVGLTQSRRMPWS